MTLTNYPVEGFCPIPLLANPPLSTLSATPSHHSIFFKPILAPRNHSIPVDLGPLYMELNLDTNIDRDFGLTKVTCLLLACLASLPPRSLPACL